ncbi:MAG: alpha/beta hydrolase [Thermodesulfobacteriota bacterium]|nr:alpha/beta hydrolase [Thermodesulfobacteriota bacterium]
MAKPGQGKEVAMVSRFKGDCSLFDCPAVNAFLFHPRKASGPQPEIAGDTRLLPRDITIPVGEDGTIIGAKFHHSGDDSPVVLFFHGNGEIVADYDEIGGLYTSLGINFFPVDYRGYGKSTGTPGVESMMADCHTIFAFAKEWLRDNGYTGNVIVMGRSLGSASALELAASNQQAIDGLIIESGFARVLPLLRLLGVDLEGEGIAEDSCFRNLEKAAHYDKPLLVIHAEYDHIIPFSDGRALFDACPSAVKQFIKIENADHNTIFYYGIEPYMSAIKEFMELVDNG